MKLSWAADALGGGGGGGGASQIRHPAQIYRRQSSGTVSRVWNMRVQMGRKVAAAAGEERRSSGGNVAGTHVVIYTC